MIGNSTAITSAADSIWMSFTSAIGTFIAYLPNLVAAVVLLVVGWLIAMAVDRIVVRVLKMVGFERAVHSAGLDTYVQAAGPKVTTSGILGQIVRWFVFLLFVQAASNVLRLPILGSTVNTVLLFLPKLAVALAIVVVGVWLARVASAALRRSMSGKQGGAPAGLTLFVRFAILGFALIAAVSQVGIAPVIVNSLFIALVASVALAVALAFGLGGREVAGRIAQRWYERSREMGDRLMPPQGAPPATASSHEPGGPWLA